jgi:hypothetical protein
MIQNTAALNSGKNASIKSQKTQPLNEKSLQITESSQRNTAPDWPHEQPSYIAIAKPEVLL